MPFCGKVMNDYQTIWTWLTKKLLVQAGLRPNVFDSTIKHFLFYFFFYSNSLENCFINLYIVTCHTSGTAHDIRMISVSKCGLNVRHPKTCLVSLTQYYLNPDLMWCVTYLSWETIIHRKYSSHSLIAGDRSQTTPR